MQLKLRKLQILNSFSGPKVESSGFYFKLEFKLKNSIVLKNIYGCDINIYQLE